MLTDTHCHLADEPLLSNLSKVMERARASGVTGFVVPSTGPDDWEAVRSLRGLPGVRTAFGVHPWKAGRGVEASLLESHLPGASAVGEIGLDGKVDVPMHKQRDCLETQLRMARRHGLPVLLHCRGAFEELLELLEAVPPPGAVLHGFSRGPGLLRRFLAAGCFIGFGGAVTRERAVQARRSAVEAPWESILLETDSPWIGVEGGPSEPASLPRVVTAMAGLRGAPEEEVRAAARRNAERFFASSP